MVNDDPVKMRLSLEDLENLKADEWYDAWAIHKFVCARCGYRDADPEETAEGLRCSKCGGEAYR